MVLEIFPQYEVFFLLVVLKKLMMLMMKLLMLMMKLILFSFLVERNLPHHLRYVFLIFLLLELVKENPFHYSLVENCYCFFLIMVELNHQIPHFEYFDLEILHYAHLCHRVLLLIKY